MHANCMLTCPLSQVISSETSNELIRIDLIFMRSCWLFLMNLGIFKPFLPLKNQFPNKYSSPSRWAADSFTVYISPVCIKILIEGGTSPAWVMVVCWFWCCLFNFLFFFNLSNSLHFVLNKDGSDYDCLIEWWLEKAGSELIFLKDI